MPYTTQKQLRAAFWEAFPDLPRRKVTDYSGKGKMYPTDTRVTWCDFVDSLQRNGEITEALASRASL
jgi:hypothetical protein